jgi:two-component system nitrogen regulation sensor histidine kinase GlnL
MLSMHLIQRRWSVCYHPGAMLMRRKRPERSPRAGKDTTSLLENVLASLGDAVILFDEGNRVTLFNQAAQELTGLSEAQALLRPCEEVFAGTPSIGQLVRRTRSSGQGQSLADEDLHLPQRRVPVRCSCSPIWGVPGHLQGIALVIQDLSYLKKLEDEAHRNETLARLGGLVAGLAHEVKNPLGGIRGAAQLLAKRFGGHTDVTEYTDVMIREIDRLSRLVEQLLTLGAPPTPDSSPLNVHKVIHEVLALLGTELTDKRIAVRLTIDPSLPDVPGDEAQLTHVFLNLVKNALEAMPADGTLTITTRMETDFHILQHVANPPDPSAGHRTIPRKFLRVEVADTGPGFPPADTQRVFEPFFTTKPRGSGLGLAICERIVAAHGGVIRAENRRGGGAVVTVHLPLVGL